MTYSYSQVVLAITGGDGSRQPSETELAGARYQGQLVAETAAAVFG